MDESLRHLMITQSTSAFTSHLLLNINPFYIPAITERGKIKSMASIKIQTWEGVTSIHFCQKIWFLVCVVWSFEVGCTTADRQIVTACLCFFQLNTFILFFNFGKKTFGGHMSFYEATDIPVLDFWWHLLRFHSQGWLVLFTLGGGIHDAHSLKSTSGATPADLLMISMAARRFFHMHV